MKKLAKIISFIFIPPVNLLLIFIFLSLSVYDVTSLQIKSISIAAIIGFAIPILVFVFLRFQGSIVDNDATIRNERTYPYLIGTALSILGTMIAMAYGLHPFIVAAWFSYIVTSIILTVINTRWKISAHAIGIAIPFAIIVFLLGPIGYLFIFLPFAVSWARVYQKLHSIPQVASGIILGYFITYLLLNLSLRLL